MGYLVASDYGVIGNHHSAALVSQFGSIDWCCFPYLDSPSHFGAFINEANGGRFQICPQGEYRSNHYYANKSLVLETLFETPTGNAVLVDWMPIEEKQGFFPKIFRRIRVLTGKVSWTLNCSPRFDYGKDLTQAEKHPFGVLFRGTRSEHLAVLYSDIIPLEISNNETFVQARFTLEAGQMAQFVWGWGRCTSLFGKDSTQTLSHQNFQPTSDYWQSESHHCATSGCLFGGPWHDLVSKSALFLKLLDVPFSGAMAHSIIAFKKDPESKNIHWEQRYSGLRNSALKIQALAQMGYVNNAQGYFLWLKKLIERDGVEGLQAIYTLDGGRVFDERPPLHSLQLQLDIYGHVILAICEYYHLYRHFPEDLWPSIVEIADYVCQAWRRPDYGFWTYDKEDLHKPEHYVVSKLFCWATLDQTIWLATELGKDIPARWRTERTILHNTICTQGFDFEQNTFVRSFGDRGVDAANLWMIFLNFLPLTDPRIIGTIDAIQIQLSNGVFLKRFQSPYETEHTEPDDLWSSFFFVCSLVLVGRLEEARDRLAELCTYASPLGIFADSHDPQAEGLVMGFPSSSVHSILINAALYVGAGRARSKLETPLLGFARKVIPAVKTA